MSYRIRCFTLFDITKTDVLNRKQPVNLTEEQIQSWEYRRNTQCNYDTISQVISLRSQPENSTNTTKTIINFKESMRFGFLFDEEEDQLCWHFDFTISHKNVFDDGITELGALDTDCTDVPIIKTGTEWDKLPQFLDTSPELRNIYFEVIAYEE